MNMLPNSKDNIFCGLDVGAEKIKVGILRAHDVNRMELLGVYEQKTVGFDQCSVTDLGQFSECIYEVVDELVKKTGVKVKDIQLGLGGELVDFRTTNTVIPLSETGTRIIRQQDIDQVNDHARLLGVKVEEEILHHLPQFYKIDDANIVVNPSRLYARKLALHSLMVVMQSNGLKNIVQAVVNSGYEVSNVFFTSYVSSEVVLTPDEKQQGCTLIDFGSRVTTIMFFKDGFLKFVGKVEIGGEHITQHLSEALNIPFSTAEEIKKSYAVVQADEEELDREILIKVESQHRPIKRREIADALEPVVKDLVDQIKTTLVESKAQSHSKSMRVVGGGALLNGLLDRLKETLGMPVQIGNIQGAQKSLQNVALFSSVIGLAKSGTVDFYVKGGSDADGENVFEKTLNRVRRLYEEYF